MNLTLTVDSAARKNIPIDSGCIRYFPAAIAGVAMHSKISNDKHNPGEPMYHSRGKSNDHADCIDRHKLDMNDMLAAMARESPSDVQVKALLTEANALAWRALAWSQELHEKYGGAPLAPAARLPAPVELTPEAPVTLTTDAVAVPAGQQYCGHQYCRDHSSGGCLFNGSPTPGYAGDPP